MKAYQPKVELRLIKTRARDNVAGDLPAASARFKQVRIINLTPYLSDGGVRTQKSIREPAGSFSISLTPRPYVHDAGGDGALLETLDNLIEPMDMVEIRMMREPDWNKNQADRVRPTVVMRGFVSQVSRSESIANGVPQRSIVVSGHDYGKIWQTAQVYYLNNSAVGDNIVHSLKFFEKYAEATDARLRTAEEFVNLFVKEMFNKYLERLTALVDKRAEMPTSAKSKVNIQGVVCPFGVGTAQDMSFYQLLARFLDVGQFNELYLDDTEDEVVLVARRQPLINADGSSDDAELESLEIGLGDVVSSQLSRSDFGVYNIFEVECTRIVTIDQNTYRTYSMESKTGSPLQLNTLNQEAAMFGERRLNGSITLNNPALEPGDAEKKEKRGGEVAKTEDWVAQSRQRLIDLNRDASVFESGSLRLKGTAKLRAGMQLRVRHSDSLTVSYYVPAVSQEYMPGAGFFTTAQVERGNGFILSAGLDRAPDLARRDLRGVL